MRAFLACLVAVAIANVGLAAQPVDLNAPGVLESLRTENPGRYAKIDAILATAEAYPASDIATWIRTEFDASDVQYAPLWHVSDPPIMSLSFALGGTRYTAAIVGRFPRPQFIPAR